MKITLNLSLFSLILVSMAIQPLSAHNTILDLTTATQETISEHKQAIAAIGAVTLVGLGAYWWHSARQVKKTPNSLVTVVAPQSPVENTKKPSFVIKLPHVSQKFLHNAQNQPLSVGVCVPTESTKPEQPSEPKNPAPSFVKLLPLQSVEPLLQQPQGNHNNDNNNNNHAQPFAISKEALENYLTNDAHYYCTKNRDAIYSHVYRGHITMRDILNGKLTMEQNPFDLAVTHADRHAHLNNIISACWYMYSVALSKGQMFEEGSFIVHDDGKLYEYLLQYVKNVNPDNWHSSIAHSSNPYGYGRHSTHLHQYQKQGHHHYGIDIREGDTLNSWEYWIPFAKQQKAHLPTGKKHILFGKVDEHRTFIKFENDGLYRYDGLLAHAFGAVTSTARKLGIGTNDGPTYRKEHMPKAVADRFKQLVKEHNLALQAPKTIAEIVQLCKEHNMLAPFLDELNAQFDHIEVRHGNEIILKPHELQMPLPDKFI